MYSTHFKTIACLILFGIGSFQAFAQIDFEKGYFIDNEGTKTEGLIENMDWQDNPITFRFKSSENADIEKKTIHNIQEFGIYTKAKFQKEALDIDRSSGTKKKVIANSKPEFVQETFFLNVLSEGEASLYQYREGEMSVFFFQIDDAPITQLISRDYIDENNLVVKDQTYIRQLFSAIKCEGLESSVFEGLRYTRNSLERFLQKYNACTGEQSIIYKNVDSKSLFHLAIKPGISFNTVNIPTRDLYSLNTNFGKIRNFRIGIELEYFLPKMNKKWSLLFEPSFEQFTTDTIYSEFDFYSVLTYKAIDANFGLKYYLNNRNSTRFFVVAKLASSFRFDSLLDFERGPDLEVVNNINFNIGAGILIKNRLSLEGSYWLIKNLSSFTDPFKSYSLILGYRLF